MFKIKWSSKFQRVPCSASAIKCFYVEYHTFVAACCSLLILPRNVWQRVRTTLFQALFEAYVTLLK